MVKKTVRKMAHDRLDWMVIWLHFSHNYSIEFYHILPINACARARKSTISLLLSLYLYLYLYLSLIYFLLRFFTLSFAIRIECLRSKEVSQLANDKHKIHLESLFSLLRSFSLSPPDSPDNMSKFTMHLSHYHIITCLHGTHYEGFDTLH